MDPVRLGGNIMIARGNQYFNYRMYPTASSECVGVIILHSGRWMLPNPPSSVLGGPACFPGGYWRTVCNGGCCCWNEFIHIG